MLRRLSRLRAVLVDLSGTIHVDDGALPGAADALNRLAACDRLKVKFVTNTTKESRRVLMERLTRIGFTIRPDQMFTSLTAARDLIHRRHLSPLLLLDSRALEEFKGLPMKQEHDSVLVGLAPDKFDYDSMNTAFRLVLDGAPLIAIHKARYYRRTDGLELGPGPFVSGLEFAAGVKAEVVGKPEKSFFTAAVREFNVKPEECVMIGDDARDDVGGAQAAGMLGILVKTGKYRAGDETKIEPPPFHTAQDIGHAVDFIIEHCSAEIT